MKRVHDRLKVCNACRFALPQDAYYEGRQSCKVCERAKELRQLGRRLDVNPLLRAWKR